MRLIDADELKKDLTRFYDNEVTAKRLIDEQPTIEPMRKKGEWIPKDDGRYYCSSCNDIAPKGYRWNFCPNCGSYNGGEKK